MSENFQELSEQLKEILPSLVNAKQILGEAAEDHKEVKDLKEKLGKLEGTITDIGSNVVELGKKRIYVQPSGLDTDQKVAFAKWITSLYKMRQHPTESGLKLLRDYNKQFRIDTKETMTEKTDIEGGYLVPDLFRDQIWRTVEQASVIMSGATKVPLTPGYKLPVLSISSGVSVDFVDEEGTVGASDPTFAKNTIEAKKLMAYTSMTNELLEDEEVGLVDLIVQLFGEAIGAKIDNVGFQSDGPQFMGILRTSGVNLTTMTGGLGKFTELTADYLIDAASKLKAPNTAGAKWYLHRTILAVIKKLKDVTSGQYLFQSIGAGEPNTIWGFPYVVCEQMPASTDTAVNTPFIFLGNLKNYLIGTKGEMTVKISDIPYITTDKSIIVFRRRIALGAGLPEAFSVIKTAASDS